MAIDPRAMENIVTAPAMRSERAAALWALGAVGAPLVIAAPFGARMLWALPPVIPAIYAVVSLLLVLTAGLLYAQYRLARTAELAILAVAYGVQALLALAYLLAFPGAFARSGLFGATPQTATHLFATLQIAFPAFIIAYLIIERARLRPTRESVRGFGAIALAATLCWILACYHGSGLPPFIDEHGRLLPAWRSGAMSLLGVVLLVSGLLLALTRLRTVVQLWLLVVLTARAIEAILVGPFSTARFTVAWYAGRIEEVVASAVILAIFLVKLNDLLFRIAERNRSLSERTQLDALALAESEARYRTLTNVVPQLVFTTDASGEATYVNERWSAYTGSDLARTQQRGWLEASEPSALPGAQTEWDHALRTGDPFARELRLREAATGRYRWFLVNVAPMRDAAERIEAWIGSATDIDAQKRLEERDAFLARAGERLGASLDVTATLGAVKALLIPRFADRCEIELLDDDHRFTLAAVGSVDLAEEAAARRELGRPASPPLQVQLERVVAADRSIIEAGMPTLRLPLGDADGPIGVLTVERAAPYELNEVSILRELARRAAVSLRHARVYERERTTADALQRAMLPQALPLRDGLEFSASYSAASESQRVGGDFYDAFTLPDGRVAFTIGDVTGHGLEAAVIMGEIRQAIRASSFERAEPSAILDRASRLLVASGRSVFVTAVFGVLDPADGRLTYATAGHPPPLVHEGERTRRLSGSGLPLGLRDGDGVDFTLVLRPPCTLVLFTDGLMEFSRDLAEGERRIEKAIRELGAARIDHLATAIMREVLGDDEPTDDIAILTLTLERVAVVIPDEVAEWSFASGDASAGSLVRREIGARIAALAGAERGLAAELAFGELLANVVRHAPGAVIARLAIAPDGSASLVVQDGGAWNGLRRPAPAAPDLLAESGRGLAIVESVAEALTIDRAPSGGTRVAVRFPPVAVATAR